MSLKAVFSGSMFLSVILTAAYQPLFSLLMGYDCSDVPLLSLSNALLLAGIHRTV